MERLKWFSFAECCEKTDELINVVNGLQVQARNLLIRASEQSRQAKLQDLRVDVLQEQAETVAMRTDRRDRLITQHYKWITALQNSVAALESNAQYLERRNVALGIENTTLRAKLGTIEALETRIALLEAKE